MRRNTECHSNKLNRCLMTRAQFPLRIWSIRLRMKTRYVMIGMSSVGLLFVSFTYRNDIVRLISARRAEKWMVKVYEDEK